MLRRYQRILIPELNTGQLRLLIRAKYLIDARGLNKIQGKPFLVEELEAAIDLMLADQIGRREYLIPREHTVRLEDQEYDFSTGPVGDSASPGKLKTPAREDPMG